MKNILSIILLTLLQPASARVIRLTVTPAVASVELHSFNGLKETVQQYTLQSGTAIIPVPVQEGLLLLTLASGNEYPLWVSATDTGYTVHLTAANALPKVTGSAISQQLYTGMSAVKLLQQRRLALAETQNGLPDSAMLAGIIKTAQAALVMEQNKLYSSLQLQMGQVANVLLWGNHILPDEVARINMEGKEAEAKANIIAFAKAHYAVAAKSNLLRNLIDQYLLVTESARIPPGSPSFENRTRADMAAWINALKGNNTPTAVTNHFIDYFLHHNMWTLTDSLMSNNANASCPAPTMGKGFAANKMFVQNNKGDSFDIQQTKAPLLLALYDVNCPSAVMEYVLMRRQLQEVYQPPVNTAVVLLNQEAASFAGAWQGMPPTIYHNVGMGYNRLAALLPKNAGLPGYWILANGKLQFIGSSYRDVFNYFNKNKGGAKP